MPVLNLKWKRKYIDNRRGGRQREKKNGRKYEKFITFIQQNMLCIARFFPYTTHYVTRQDISYMQKYIYTIDINLTARDLLGFGFLGSNPIGTRDLLSLVLLIRLGCRTVSYGEYQTPGNEKCWKKSRKQTASNRLRTKTEVVGWDSRH